MSLPSLFDNLRLPVIGSPLFIISGPELVIAQCKAGIVGSFPALNARPQSQLDEWIHQITEELAAYDRENPDQPAAPFAVNQIVHRSNNRLEEDMVTCAKWKVPMMITSLGAREELNVAAHEWGGIVMHDVINDRYAHKAIEKGAARDQSMVRWTSSVIGFYCFRCSHTECSGYGSGPCLYRECFHSCQRSSS